MGARTDLVRLAEERAEVVVEFVNCAYSELMDEQPRGVARARQRGDGRRGRAPVARVAIGEPPETPSEASTCPSAPLIMLVPEDARSAEQSVAGSLGSAIGAYGLSGRMTGLMSTIAVRGPLRGLRSRDRLGAPQTDGHRSAGTCTVQAQLADDISVRDERTPIPCGDVAGQGRPVLCHCAASGVYAPQLVSAADP